MSQILVVDDEPSICWSFEQALGDLGHTVASTATAETALSLLDEFSPEVILLDYRLPGMNGLAALKKFRAVAETTPVILMTAYGSLDLAVDTIGFGAFDYLPKPFDLDHAVELVASALRSRTSLESSIEITAPAKDELLGSSRVMQEVFRQIAIVAQQDVPVLITGERGVGKETTARAIHRHSARAAGHFASLSVAGLNESAIEYELFGHVRRTFTGSEDFQPGVLSRAHNGTLFIDEIDQLPLSLQVKLLQTIEDRQVIPTGGRKAMPADVRLIAATQHSLESLVGHGLFREDLFYRLNVFRIEIPPLRERTEDLPVLAERFLARVAGERAISISPETITVLRQRQWPGNVRELRSAIQHAALVCRGNVLTPEFLPPETVSAPSRSSAEDVSRILELLRTWADEVVQTVDPRNTATCLFEQFLNTFEPPILAAALDAVNGNRKAAADLLGLHRETLRKRLRKYELGE
ncbi:sigma-54-dependent transcriptional regulator [Planctomicrobium piriforme]|uniref:DNA-binding transcriptional regulator NtrC n=1 Tax=Planctomicrobium piriforme TaxID=1576369 RepID=A0A1I3MP58_9PLAN|nr:sigma-54 dependent transcriptional regulator [Planctomicrobium piriforme]SFI98456.1 two-component system, NtrC family, nitrogen regulation response regulator GlnG [Planctomicrobium piriforme]